MNKVAKNAAVLWTGGKDSSLALYQAQLQGYNIARLATFVPKEPEFFAHPLNFLKYQADALGIPHCTLTVNEPFKEGYEKAIDSLRRRHGIATLVTGDIAEVDGHPNWIRECSEYSGVEVLTPLWGWEILELLHRLLAYNFKVIFSCVKKPWFTDDWLGIELNANCVEQLCAMNAETGLDICGEQGEYHTLVLDGPPFRKSISISAYSKRAKDSLMYLDISKAVLTVSVRDR